MGSPFPALKVAQLEFSLAKNADFDEAVPEKNPRYFIQVSFANGEHKLSLPVWWRSGQQSGSLHKETFSCSIAGQVVEKGNLPAFMEAVKEHFRSLSRGGYLPAHFVAAEAGGLVPVYPDGKSLRASAGGVQFRGGDIAEVWTHMADLWLQQRPAKEAEHYVIYTLSWLDMSLLPWLGLLVSVPKHLHRGPVLAHPTIADRGICRWRGQALTSAPGSGGKLHCLLELWEQLAAQLVPSKQISSPYQLEIWGVARSSLEHWEDWPLSSHKLVYSRSKPGDERRKETIPLYRREDRLLAVVPGKRSTYQLLLGEDRQELAERVAQRMVARGVLSEPGELSVESWQSQQKVGA